MLRSRATGRLGILLNEDITCRLPVGLVERHRDAPRFHFPTCPRRVTAAPIAASGYMLILFTIHANVAAREISRTLFPQLHLESYIDGIGAAHSQ